MLTHTHVLSSILFVAEKKGRGAVGHLGETPLSIDEEHLWTSEW